MFVDSLTNNLEASLNITTVVKNDVKSALDHLKSGHIYHFIILDLNMPELDGFQFMDTLIDLEFHFPVIILSGSEKTEDLCRLRDYNIAGYITKKSSFSELQDSLEKIFNGEQIIPTEYAFYFDPNYKEEKENPEVSLSSRKIEILSYIEQGLTNDEIANKLFISSNTVKDHITKISRILNVSGRIKCLNKAKDLGIL